MATKTTKKKQQKVLSQAAQKRLELERQEAAKSKVEKLAESIKNRSNISGKHNSVVRQVGIVEKRNTPIVKAKLKSIKKVKQQAPAKRDTDYDVFLAEIADRDKRHHHLFKQAENLRNRLAKMSARETTKFHEALRECYGMYESIENNKDSSYFYDTIRGYFKVTLVNIQSNTPNEALLIRFVFANKSTKQISEYATVLRYAREINIAKKDFIKWYTETTQTRILAAARKSSTTDNEEKVKRARVVLLRYFDIREQWPLGHFDYPEYLAQKQVHLPNDLIFVVCRGVRKFNRDVFHDPNNPTRDMPALAEISALHFIPTGIDLVNDIINRMARFIAPVVEQYEKEIDEKSEQLWANDLTNFLMERELGAAYKSADRWADRMQASISEDQIAFEAKRRKIQKLRNKTRKQ